MSSPIDGTPASRAPRLPASMIPGPPPVMIENPARPSAAAVARAVAYIGSSREVRAEPKIETALPTCASRSKPVRSSSSIRCTRSASSSWETIAGESASSSSSSDVVGGRGWVRRNSSSSDSVQLSSSPMRGSSSSVGGLSICPD